mmetsp:Transcript_2683/g.4520  ORF Transcript_2683/g.4520 Transcript_2683/m.4520 type:complete len:315 (+) Transcript_2683:151-1095(+)
MKPTWGCPECGTKCEKKKECAKLDDGEGCGCCEHSSACRPFACTTCFEPCRNPEECVAKDGCGTCDCDTECMPWACLRCGKQCLDPAACGDESDACGCCDCDSFCKPTAVPMDGVVPPGGHQLGDTISRRKLEDGEELPRDRVVFVGDSDIEYWGDSGWSDEFQNCVNIGMGGATIREAARHVVSMVEMLRPKGFVVLCSGENDMDVETDDVEPLFEHWKFVVETIRESVHSPVVIMIGCKPEPDSEELYGVYKQYDSLIKTYATQNPESVIFIDMWEQLHAVGNSESLYRDDGLHLSDEGYEILTSVVKAVME